MKPPLAHALPADIPRCSWVHVRVDGVPLDLLATGEIAFGSFQTDDACEIRLQFDQPVHDVRVSPRRFGIEPFLREDGLECSFRWRGSGQIQIKTDVHPELYLSTSPTERPPGFSPGECTHTYEAGRVHSIGLVKPRSGDVIWVEGGAVLRGAFHLENLTNVRLGGHGLLMIDSEIRTVPNLVLLEDCSDCRLYGLTLVKSPGERGWCCLIGGSQRIAVQGLSILSHTGSQDGLDICGCSEVDVGDCLFHTGDDCIAIKALDFAEPSEFVRKAMAKRGGDVCWTPRRAFAKSVDGILVERCLLHAACAGNAIEIGFETRADVIQNLVFRDSDILGVHARGPGAAFGIHNGDRAWVRNVTFESIRVAHYYARLFDFQVLKSRWNIEPGQGRVSDILVRNIHLDGHWANEGYSPSLVGSCNAQQPIENIRFENIRRDGCPLASVEELELFTRNARGIHFC